MRILLIHNYYQKRGGEDVVFENEKRLLQLSGHEVETIEITNKSISSSLGKIRTFYNSGFSHKVSKTVNKKIHLFQPDVVHVHNFWPLLSPSVHVASALKGVPVVQTLHNYRLMCGNGMFFRNGKVCTKCIDGGGLWGVVHRCYRSSFIASIAVYRMQRAFRRYVKKFDDYFHFIALTEFAKNKFVKYGIPPENLVVKPNACFGAEVIEKNDALRNGILFVGRLSEEKGLITLIKAAEKVPELEVKIAGDGPMLSYLRQRAPKNVKFLGFLNHVEVANEMSSALALVVPSKWYEGFPMVIVEAMKSSLPTVCSRLGSLAEVVDDGENGYHFTPGSFSDLAVVLKKVSENRELMIEMGKRAYFKFLKEYNSKKNIENLENIYQQAIRKKKI